MAEQHPPRSIRTLSGFHRAILIGSLPMLLLSALTVPPEFWRKAAQFLSRDDMLRFWANRVLAIGAFLFCAAFFFISLHLVVKKVILTEDGVEFFGLIRRSLRWIDVAEARVERERHTSSLVLLTFAGKRYEIGIGDREAAVVCETIVATIARKQVDKPMSPRAG